MRSNSQPQKLSFRQIGRIALEGGTAGITRGIPSIKHLVYAHHWRRESGSGNYKDGQKGVTHIACSRGQERTGLFPVWPAG